MAKQVTMLDAIDAVSSRAKSHARQLREAIAVLEKAGDHLAEISRPEARDVKTAALVMLKTQTANLRLMASYLDGQP